MAGHPVRRFWVLVHRYAGLFMAGFLILEGITGSVLAFQTPIGEWLAPRTFASPNPSQPPLGLGVLAARVERMEPRARVGFFSVDGRQAGFSMLPRTNPTTGKPFALGFDHLVVDPWTGQELARFRHGDLSQGAVNIVPFIYDLHQNLATGPWGTILLGVVAVIWTIDCFIAVYLTLPTELSRFPAGWRKAWAVKRPSHAFRLNFDLHRASGLWLWPALAVFAWSSVMFTLPEQVYTPVTKALFSYDSEADVFARMGRRPQRATPKLGWVEAQAVGERLMARAAAERGFRIIRPYGMAYIPGWNVYTYAAQTRGAVMAAGWESSLWLDGDTGALVELDVASTRKPGNTVDLWLRALHFGDLSDNLFYRSFVFLIGIATTLLVVTGVYVWWRKSRARRLSRRRRTNALHNPANPKTPLKAETSS